MYRHLTILILSILISGCSNTKKTVAGPPAYKKVIESDFMVYYNAIVNKEFEKSMEYMLPAFFDIVPKEQMVAMMEQAFNNPGMAIELKDVKMMGIGDAEEVESKHYSRLQYSNTMRLKMDNEEGETDEDKKSRMELTKLSFQNVFGGENVTYDSETGWFDIFTLKEVIAISDNGQSNWKFLVVEEEQKFILEQLIPKKIMDKL